MDIDTAVMNDTIERIQGGESLGFCNYEALAELCKLGWIDPPAVDGMSISFMVEHYYEPSEGKYKIDILQKINCEHPYILRHGYIDTKDGKPHGVKFLMARQLEAIANYLNGGTDYITILRDVNQNREKVAEGEL